jgi:UDPglucose--hexose-1-phosphate uridylyltransferase
MYGIIFKNVGRGAGATLYHSHSQLIATPTIPRNILQKLNTFHQHYEYRERCLFCDIAAQEQDQQSRIVLDSGRFLSFAPYASRFPFELWVAPKFHGSHFEALSPEHLEELAFLLKRSLQKLEKGLNRPGWNYMLFTAPFRSTPSPIFHWHLEIIPRLTSVAGFEWGTGFYINPVPPEDAAAFLRNTKL